MTNECLIDLVVEYFNISYCAACEKIEQYVKGGQLNDLVALVSYNC